MPRLILTFENLFQVLAAEKLLRTNHSCRTVPTPSGLSTDICGISIELLKIDDESGAIKELRGGSLAPKGVHHLP